MKNIEEPKTLGPVTTINDRGFPVIRFKDYYGVPCSVQMSSLAIYEKPGTSALWIGTDDAQPKVMASQAAHHGVKTERACVFDIPKGDFQ